MAHHSNEHVDKYDDDEDMVCSEEERSDALDYRRRVITSRERVRNPRITRAQSFSGVFYLDTVYGHQTKHGPEQTVQRQRQTAINNDIINSHCTLLIANCN